ncbi:hypothetical protein L226DRAFT_536112 [Lentinus tigrinus ALCF2SS1-7]|uniref:Uncharacterized protein n=1 Tax=Lentinus tigrinus ALCF2SS1-6 TaxID=1328759 RepID=A0A5C2RU59_9APHY|nr:hypothetical protein L227DRAFT_580771 [Lentinus tigrinus ALCF2SS1-6]RPD73840.1 hypothetical protein L226DRAFT_536112 [Lentinus tigrinus ALCF2SS1-7]
MRRELPLNLSNPELRRGPSSRTACIHVDSSQHSHRGTSAIIHTLDPAKLTPQDHLTPASYVTATSSTRVYIKKTRDDSPRVLFMYNPKGQDPRQFHNQQIGGFLYYHQPQARAPPLVGELRFRITPSSDPVTFSSGDDLKTRRGVPWCITLPALAYNKSFLPIRHLLTTVDGMVPQHVMDFARKHHHKVCAGDVIGSRYLYAFGQPFDLPLDRNGHTFTFIGKEGLARARIWHMSSFKSRILSEACQSYHFPLAGTILCCFEPSSLPEHAGKRVAIVRVLRSLEWDPVRANPSYTGPQMPRELYPREGQLLLRMSLKEKPRICAYDVDNASGTTNSVGPLGILFDNAIEYGVPGDS